MLRVPPTPKIQYSLIQGLIFEELYSVNYTNSTRTEYRRTYSIIYVLVHNLNRLYFIQFLICKKNPWSGSFTTGFLLSAAAQFLFSSSLYSVIFTRTH
jgi:hypothetical protein